MEKVILVIPARYASTRLAAKPLAMIHHKPMIQWVYERAKKAEGVDRIIVATDDTRIQSAVREFGGEAWMTSPNLQSGTDRVAAIADEFPAEIYVNLQGDEPLMSPKAIEAAVKLVKNQGFPMATVMTPLKIREDLENPSVVKVIADRKGRAIYFSRLPIPYSRGEIPPNGQDFVCRKHVGLYVYRRETLFQFRDLAVSGLEKGEVLEQLRALESGISIGISEVDFQSIGVDTPEDLEKVRQLLV